MKNSSGQSYSFVCTALCVFPRWTTQAWWPQLPGMMVGNPLRIPPSPINLQLPNKPGESHPLHKKLELIICILSGQNIRPKDFPTQPLIWYWRVRETPLSSNMLFMQNCGLPYQGKGLSLRLEILLNSWFNFAKQGLLLVSQVTLKTLGNILM